MNCCIFQCEVYQFFGPESKGNPFETMEHGTPIFTSLDIIFGECKVLKVLKHHKNPTSEPSTEIQPSERNMFPLCL